MPITFCYKVKPYLLKILFTFMSFQDYLAVWKMKRQACTKESSHIKAFCSLYQSRITTGHQRHLTVGHPHGACGPHCISEQSPTGWESMLPTVHLPGWGSSSKSLCQAASKSTDYEQQWPTDGAVAAPEVPVCRIICQLSPSKLEITRRGSAIAQFNS